MDTINRRTTRDWHMSGESVSFRPHDEWCSRNRVIGQSRCGIDCADGTDARDWSDVFAPPAEFPARPAAAANYKLSAGRGRNDESHAGELTEQRCTDKHAEIRKICRSFVMDATQYCRQTVKMKLARRISTLSAAMLHRRFSSEQRKQ